MRILVVGNGGREHALAWKLAQSPRTTAVFATRPNAGLALVAEAVDLDPSDVAGLTRWAADHAIDLTVVGPELPLTLGIVDAFEARGLRVFGPSAAAARLEGSKAYAKDVMNFAGVPTAAYGTFTDLEPALEWVRDFGRPVAVKADGLAGGKGVILCETVEEAETALREMLVAGAFGHAGARVVVEELLRGEEASFIAVCDGEHVLALASSQDHKRIGEGDTGPNTGGMGAFSPAPVVTDAVIREVMDRVMLPTVKHMAEAGAPFRGFLYAGLMITQDGPRVLEFNVRLGDPETQPLLMRLDTDLVDLLEAALDGGLDTISLDWDPRPALCVVMASDGYPGKARTGDIIEGLAPARAMADVEVFCAGVSQGSDGEMRTSGGRVLGVTALGSDLRDAAKRAYRAVDRIHWRGAQSRRDIGWRVLSGERG